MSELKNRYDFVILFDVQDGNPNGDPDAGNLPRIDPETGHGLVTDVCLKRKIRNYVAAAKENQPPHEIYVKEKAILNEQHRRAYTALDIKMDKKKQKRDDVDKVRQWMCQNFFDIRTFGAVMSTGVNCGQVRGPVQLTFSRSLDPIVASEHSITRMAVTTIKEAEAQGGDNRTMGRKATIPYGLYFGRGFVSPQLAAQTGFSEDDLGLLWTAIQKMFEVDRSAARGMMATRKLIVFKHDSSLGNAPAHELFDRVKVVRKQLPARSFLDYDVTIDQNELPSGIEVQELI
ncbi:MAG: type I-C CRISPR-associated protein Cas7/Csd2 [Candidatus Alcyoniella australis]|nr:type I-C CRISPR-associated protein Cas7/Csd2 [Candidatus Alcyoniella australis]